MLGFGGNDVRQTVLGGLHFIKQFLSSCGKQILNIGNNTHKETADKTTEQGFIHTEVA